MHITAQKPDSTGSGVYLSETVRAFAALGHAQAVIAGIAPEDHPDFPVGVLFHPVVFETEELPFPVVGMSDVMPYKATRYRDLTPSMVEAFKGAFASALHDVLDSFAPDLIICHHLYMLCALVVHEKPGCTVVGISHSTDIRQMRKIGLERTYIIEGIEGLDEVLALHAAQAREIEQVFGIPADRIRIIGTGYNDDVFHRIDGLRSNARHEIAYAGKIWEKKGVRSLVHAVDLLPYPPESVRLRCVGGYSDRAEYESIVAQANRARCRIEFPGRLRQVDLARVYNEADVFVLPSFFEGLPLVVVEALACGCKVVVTDLPGIREWLDAKAPTAPVTYIEPPRMYDTDEANPADLPRFERDIASALQESIESEPSDCSVEHLSWKSLCCEILQSGDAYAVRMR